MQVTVDGHIVDLGPNPSKLMEARWTGVLSPEPETVAWINSLTPGKGFYDIGASVGVHTIRAALRGLIVTAFEPHEPSYRDLLETVSRNRLFTTVCVPCALFDETVYDGGYLGRGRSKYTALRGRGSGQSCTLMTLDTYVGGGAPPAYIKLDVDGNEAQIIEGGLNTLKHVESMLVEVDPVINSDIPYRLQELGFRFDPKQVESCMIREGKYKGMANYVFFK